MDIFNQHKNLNDKNIILMYSGPIWSEGIAELGTRLKECLKIEEVASHTVQDFFSVFVEQANNMLMYSAEKIYGLPKGTIILGKDKNSFFIQTCNAVKKDNVELIKKRIAHLNTLNKKELHDYYKEQMRKKDDNPESKGSGLGFTEIARRTSSKLKYSFTPINDLIFFKLYVTIEPPVKLG